MSRAGAIRAGRAFVELFADDSMLVRTLRRAEAKVVKFGQNLQAIGRRLFMLGAAMGAPFVASMRTFSSFDDQMRAVKAVTGSTGKEFETLTEKAKLLGRTTSFTASQIAGAMLELGRAGFAPKEIDDAIASVLNLARATGTDLAVSAEICSNTLRSFELPATEMVRVSDVMVAAANNSATTLEDLGHAMSYCAPIASEYGLTLEQTAKALGSLANYGIKGSQAGTTMRRVLTSLASPAIQKKLKGIGVSVVDQDTGQMREVSAVLRDVGAAASAMPKDKKLGLFKEIFGLFAIAGGAKLTVAQFDKLIEAVDNAAGTGSQAAKEMDGGIGGSLRMMWSAVEGVAIAIGEALAPSLQKLTDWLTAACSGIADYLTKNKELVVYVAKVIAAITGIGAALFVTGLGFVGVGKTIGLVATAIASVAKVGLAGLGILSGAFKAVTFVAGSVVSVFSGMATAIGVVFSGIASTVGVVFGAAFSVMATVGTAVFSAIGVAISTALSPIGLTIIALGAVAGACYLVYRNAAPIGNVIATTFRTVVGSIENAVTAVYRFLAGFTEFRILFGTISIVTTAVKMLGGTLFWVANSLIKPAFSTIFAIFMQLGKIVLKSSAVIVSVLFSCFRQIFGAAQTVFAAVGSIVVSSFSRTVSATKSILFGIASLIGRAFSPVLGVIGTVIRGVVAVISTLGGALRSVAGWIFSFARSFFVVETAVQVFSLVCSAVSGLVGIFSRVAGTIATTLFSAVQSFPAVVSRTISVLAAVPGFVLPVFRSVPAVISAAFSGAVSVVRGVIGGISSIFSGLVSFMTGMWNGLVATFSAVFTVLGNIVSGFGDFFLGAFASVGTAVDWLRQQFGNLCSFAVETFGAITAALGRGDIEAAIGVIWASIKLIWVKGSTSLLSTWYWVVDTLQTAWANCVYKISELLTAAWYGIQAIWTDSVYTMQVAWINFMNSITQAWDYVSTTIAQGIGWIMAKIMGLDPNEMAATITEDYNNRTKQRQDSGRSSIDSLAQQRNEKIAALEKEKQGTLDILKQDFENAAGVRNAAYEAKLAAQEQELEAAKAAYDEAIHRARNPELPQAGESQSLAESLQAKVQDAVSGFKPATDLDSKVSVTGSFSAAEIQGMGLGSSMDRVAKATEKSEKHLEKIAAKDDASDNDVVAKKETAKDSVNGEDLAVRELKLQTRYLRDLSEKGSGIAFA